MNVNVTPQLHDREGALISKGDYVRAEFDGEIRHMGIIGAQLEPRVGLMRDGHHGVLTVPTKFVTKIARPFRVGDVIVTFEGLKYLPIWSIVRAGKHAMTRSGNGMWYSTLDGEICRTNVWGPFTILFLGDGSLGDSVTHGGEWD